MSRRSNDEWKVGCILWTIVIVVIGIIGLIRVVATPSGWGF